MQREAPGQLSESSFALKRRGSVDAHEGDGNTPEMVSTIPSVVNISLELALTTTAG